ncbi:MAG: GTPase RsgA [Chryseolinea sp.]
MTILKNFGWTTVQNEYAITNADSQMLPGRVISIRGFKYILITSDGELETELSGKLLYGALPEDLPKVGDWVFYISYDAQGYVISVFPRTNELARKTPGSKMQRQILATNIDMALIVQGLDDNFNLMRLERYIVQLTSCSIKCIVVLNKADLALMERSTKQRLPGWVEVVK